ncbi:MAG: hypothetical protein WBA57_05930 [Elainellaceae cyanobacterium]
MAKRKPKPGKCVHCLKTFENLTWDHVFPQAWYPTTTKPDEYKWQVPSCQDCNREYGNLENDFLTRISIFLEPSDLACAGIFEKGMRALDPKYAKNNKDKKFRKAKKEKILRELWVGEEIPQKHLYPNFGLSSHLPIEEQVAVPIRSDSVQRIAEKIVRGIFYIEDHLLIEPPYKIESYVLSDKGYQRVIDAAKRFGSVYKREPGITVFRAVVPECSPSSLFAIEIWKRWKVYATVLVSDVT